MMTAAKQNIFLIGPMGTGKTSVGRKLATRLGKQFYDLDEQVEQLCGVDIAWIFDVEGEAGFRRRETQVLAELVKYKNMVLSTGGGTVTTTQNCTLLKAHGVVIYLEASVEAQMQRTQRTGRRPLLQGKDRQEKIIELMKARGPLYASIADIRLETTGAKVDAIVRQIIAARSW